MHRHPTFLRLLLIISLAGLTRLSAQVTQVWLSGTGPWDTTTANWSGAVWTNGNNATLGSASFLTGTLTVDAGGISVNNVSSGTGSAVYNYTLQGGPITIGGATTWTLSGGSATGCWSPPPSPAADR